jgi:phosphoglycolate phosphatase
VTDTDTGSTVADDLDDFEAVVYDLDGTLVRLDVDWDAVARDALGVFAAADVTLASDTDLWAMLDVADEHGLRDDLEAVIAGHERAGARTSARLALADRLPTHAVPVGVCSLNSEGSVVVALDTHDLADGVDAVVGRDTVSTRKPDPEPLLATLRRVNVEPRRAVFVGDSPRDRTTAERAGVAYRSVESFGADPDR